MIEEKKKDARLNIRIDASLRNEFQRLCEDRSINGSDLIRKFVEKWVSENRE